MSQLTRTVFASWGLIVGWNIAPPPPGPIILKLPGRSSDGIAKASATSAIRRTRKFNLLLSFAFVHVCSLAFCQNLLAFSIPMRKEKPRHRLNCQGVDQNQFAREKTNQPASRSEKSNYIGKFKSRAAFWWYTFFRISSGKPIP